MGTSHTDIGNSIPSLRFHPRECMSLSAISPLQGLSLPRVSISLLGKYIAI